MSPKNPTLTTPDTETPGYRSACTEKISPLGLLIGCLVLALAVGPGAALGTPKKTALDPSTGPLRIDRSPSGDSFSVWSEVGEPTALPLLPGARPHRLEVANGRFWLSAVEATGDKGAAIVVLRGQGTQVERLPRPAARSAQLLLEPTLLVNTSGLRGILWLEGDRVQNLAVRAATWTGSSWTPPVTVAPPGPGTQIALTAAVLTDGSWLAAWSAFDGQDDEILWSRAEGGRWSDPLPVATSNQVPDITPSLLATGGGALLAWSQFHTDGHYRAVIAAFDGKSWGAAQTAGGPGTHFPELQQVDRPLLLYRQSKPHQWVFSEIDSQGQVLRRATLLSERDEAPLIVRADDRGPEAMWPGNAEEKAATTTPLQWGEGSE